MFMILRGGVIGHTDRERYENEKDGRGAGHGQEKGDRLGFGGVKSALL